MTIFQTLKVIEGGPFLSCHISATSSKVLNVAGYFKDLLPAGGVAPWIKLWPLTKRAGVRIPSVLTNAHALVR